MDQVSLRQLTCFLEVCRDLHFTRAAERLGMAQPPLSRQIRLLEEAIGGPLFERAGRTVRLTAAGETLLREVAPFPGMLQRALNATRRVATGEGVVLRLGFVGGLLGRDLLDLFQRFRTEHPTVQLSLFDLSPADLLEQVARGELEGAFLGVAPVRLPEGVVAHPWKREPLLAWFGREGRSGSDARKTVEWEELSAGSMVTLGEALAPSYRTLVDRLFLERGLRPPVVREANAISAVLSLVVAGCGFAFLPPSVVAPVADRLVSRKLPGRAIELEEVLVTRSEAPELIGVLLEVLRAD